MDKGKVKLVKGIYLFCFKLNNINIFNWFWDGDYFQNNVVLFLLLFFIMINKDWYGLFVCVNNLIEVVMFRKLVVECFGIFWFVFGGCGSVVFVVVFFELGIGFVGVVLVFGLMVLIMVFVVGYIFGGYFNLVVILGLWVGGCFLVKEVIGYIIVQVVGGIIVVVVLYVVVSGKVGFDVVVSGFVFNGYGEYFLGGFFMLLVIVIEIVLICGFLLVIYGVIDKYVLVGFVFIVIGLVLIFIYLISILVINILVNLVCSIVVVIFQGGWVLQQLWLFWVMLIVGGIFGGVLYCILLEKCD